MNAAFRSAAAEDRWRTFLQFEDQPIVSSDVAPTTFSSIFDSLATMTMAGRVSKTLHWFDSGFAYAQRGVELLERYAARDAADGGGTAPA